MPVGPALGLAPNGATVHSQGLPAPGIKIAVKTSPSRFSALNGAAVHLFKSGGYSRPVPKWSADDPKKGCVVDKINEFRKTVKDKTKTVEERRFALRFLIHCIEDMHMPMHVGDNHDRGGNDTQVRFFDKGTNMHRLWDSDMIERVSKDEEFWLTVLDALDTQGNAKRR